METKAEVSEPLDGTNLHSPSSSSQSPRGEVVYDATQIEELEHFDIGEVDPDGVVEISAEDVNVWPPGEATPVANCSNYPRRPGRGKTQVVHINPRRMPTRQARVKSFKRLVEDTVPTDEESPVVSEMKDDVVSRVFVASDDPVHHLGWTLFSRNPENASVAAHIILTEAGSVNPEQICSTVPQEFTGVGTFVVNMNDLRNRHELGLDALGSWGVPQGRSKFYKVNSNSNKAVVSNESDYTMKVLCNRYIHPGTDSRGVFIKKIYTGVSPEGVPSLFGVIVYEWEGTPHPVSVSLSSIPHAGSIRERAFGSRSWEGQDIDLLHDEGATFRGQPVFLRVAVDFETACRILLATVVIQEQRICTRIPQKFRECGTFVLDLARCGGERIIGKDGREWNKPSGSSRFFRFDADGNAIRVDSSAQTPPPEDFDVQIIAKRYETEQLVGLVRKIFVARERETPRINSNLAVVTYLYRPDPTKGSVYGGRIVGASRKRSISRLDDEGEDVDIEQEEEETNDCDQLAADPSTSCDLLNLKRQSLAKQMENQLRMEGLLDRAESFLDKFERAGSQEQVPLVRHLLTEWQQGVVDEEIVIGDEGQTVDEYAAVQYTANVTVIEDGV